MINLNPVCVYREHDFKPTGRKEYRGPVILTEFECSKCGISTSWEVTN
jgi:hypothetical protein